MAWDHGFSLINSSIAALHMSAHEFISCFISTVRSSNKQSCTHHAGPDTTPCTARTSTQQRGRRPHRLLDQWIASAAAQFHLLYHSRPNQATKVSVSVFGHAKQPRPSSSPSSLWIRRTAWARGQANATAVGYLFYLYTNT